MTTDDARVVDAKACQVESWQRFNQQGTPSFWAVPACSPTDGLELSVGGAGQSHEGKAHLAHSLVQGKILLRSLRSNDWGLALALRRSDERIAGHGHAHGHYLNMPMSYSFRDDALVLHLNLGRRYALDARRNTWGVGSELQLRPGLQLIAETYGESGQRAFAHAGLRHWVVPERVQLDATYGTESRWGSSHRWISIGLRLLSPPFLP